MDKLMPVILLTGEPGVGKSTIIKQLAELASTRAAGFYTRELRQDRIGFEIVTLGGKAALLATKESEPEFANQVIFEGYRVNLDAMETVAIPALQSAMSNAEILIIDEIGPMEIFSAAFCQTISEILHDDTIAVVGTIVKRPYEFADWVKTHPRVTIIEVTLENRDDLAAQMYSESVEQHMEDRELQKKIDLSQVYSQQPERFDVLALELKMTSAHDTRHLTYGAHGWTCTCDFFQKRKTCSHSMAAQRLVKSAFPTLPSIVHSDRIL